MAIDLQQSILCDVCSNAGRGVKLLGKKICLDCAGNDPAPQVGDSEGAPNHVTGRETGQCRGL